MSAKEILQKLIEDKGGVKDSLENKESLETKSQAQENTDSVDSTFKEIQDLTKLDKETLKRNLENNPSFEDDIISIVQDITKSVDAKYSKNVSLEISV